VYQEESKDDHNEDLFFMKKNNIKLRISTVRFGAGFLEVLA